MSKLILYSTSYCHLCEQAMELISPYLKSGLCSLEVIDISDSDSLIDKYGLTIPVITMEGINVELNWPFDDKQLIDFLTLEQDE